MSTLEVKELSHPTGEVLKIATGKTLDLKSQGTTTLPAGSVLQVVQGTASEQSQNASNVVLVNQSFTPKASGSKFYVSFTIPNLTGDAAQYFQAKAYIGTSSTPTSNTEIIYCRTHGQGTGAADTMTLSANDFGTYTAPNTNTHYVSLLCTTGGTWTIARHSAIIKLQCLEVSA